METQPKLILLPNSGREFNPNDESHKEKIKAFARAKFGDFEAKHGKDNPVRWFKCCDGFCTRTGAAWRTHPDGHQITYADIKREKGFKTAEEFADVLIELLNEDFKSNRRVYLPTFNTPHFEHFDDIQEVRQQKEQSAKKDEEIGSLGKRLQEAEGKAVGLGWRLTEMESSCDAARGQAADQKRYKEEAQKDVSKLEKEVKNYEARLAKYKALVNGCQDCTKRNKDAMNNF